MQDVFLLAQIIGFIAMAVGMIAWQVKKSRLISFNLGVSDSLWAIQYLLLNAHTGAFLLVGAALRNFCAAYFNKKGMKFVVALYLGFAIIISLMNHKELYDLLPLIGTVFFSLSLLQPDNRELIARASIISNLCWTSYAFFSLSYLGVLYGVILGTSKFIGMARHENWQIGKCYRSFTPSIARALFTMTKPQTYP